MAAVALFVCISARPAAADIYQYVDENGVLHFTNVNGGGKHHKLVKSEARNSRQTAAPAPSKARPAAAPPSSRADIPAAYLDLINSACDRHGVDPSLVHAIVKVESDYNPGALSQKGAMGLMQLMPQTAVNMNIKNSFDPAENIDGGVKYLKYLIDRYEGNLSLALAAYNSGETAVKRWGTIPPYKETQDYVKRILLIYNGYNGYNGGNATIATRYTIYMSYGEDGSLLLTDNPSNHQNRNSKPRKKTL